MPLASSLPSSSTRRSGLSVSRYYNIWFGMVRFADASNFSHVGSYRRLNGGCFFWVVDAFIHSFYYVGTWLQWQGMGSMMTVESVPPLNTLKNI